MTAAHKKLRGGPGGWWFGTEVEVELAVRDVFLPDVAGWRKERVPERPRGRPVRVRPDWVCEILSPSNASIDLGRKLDAYGATGEGHVVTLSAGRGDVVRAEPFDPIEIRVADLFGGD